MSPQRSRAHTLTLTAIVIAVAWGVFAFGAVYPWAYVPLAVASALLGVIGLVQRQGMRPPISRVAIALCLVVGAAAVQLAPLPEGVLERVSPGTVRFLSQYDLGYAMGVSADSASDPDSARRPAHPISLEATSTATAIGLMCAFSLLIFGTSSVISITGALPLVRALFVIGALLAVIGIGQYSVTRGLTHPMIYGFWAPTYNHANPFGPFVNPNHFAGWMLMVIPLALGLFQDALLRVTGWMSHHRHNWIAAFNTPEFAVLGSSGVAILVMGVSLLLTASRSGIGAFMAGSVLAVGVLMTHQPSRAAQLRLAVVLVVLFVGVWAWAGLTDSLAKFVSSSQGVSTIGGRGTVWRDALRILGDFPLAGTGLNTFSRAMVLYQSTGDLHFEQAHNDYLQLAAEGGLLLGVPILILVGTFAREVRRRFNEAPRVGTTYWIRVGAVIGMLSLALQSIVEFSLQMPGNAALFAILAGIALHQSPNLRTPHASSRSRKADVAADLQVGRFRRP